MSSGIILGGGDTFWIKNKAKKAREEFCKNSFFVLKKIRKSFLKKV
jgi:hypothetical protein